MKIRKSPLVFPTIEEIKAYCKEIKSSVEPDTFLLYYRTKGRELKNWKSAVRIWEKYQSSSSTS